MSLEELIERIGNSLGSDVTIQAVEKASPECIEIDAKDLLKVMSFLHEDSKFFHCPSPWWFMNHKAMTV